MINFNEPPYMEKSMDYIRKAVENKKICGDGEYTKKCNAWLEEHTGTKKALLTTSCTHATCLLYTSRHKSMLYNNSRDTIFLTVSDYCIIICCRTIRIFILICISYLCPSAF